MFGVIINTLSHLIIMLQLSHISTKDRELSDHMTADPFLSLLRAESGDWWSLLYALFLQSSLERERGQGHLSIRKLGESQQYGWGPSRGNGKCNVLFQFLNISCTIVQCSYLEKSSFPPINKKNIYIVITIWYKGSSKNRSLQITGLDVFIDKEADFFFFTE